MPRRKSPRPPSNPTRIAEPAPPPLPFGPGQALTAAIEVAVSAFGLLALASDLGDIESGGVILGGVLALVGGAVAVYTYATGLPRHLWGPTIDGWPATIIDSFLLLLAVISVGLMAAVHPALGMIAIQGLLAGIFIGAVRRAKHARGCAGVIGVGYGALLLVIGVFLYQELRDDPTRHLQPRRRRLPHPRHARPPHHRGQPDRRRRHAAPVNAPAPAVASPGLPTLRSAVVIPAGGEDLPSRRHTCRRTRATPRSSNTELTRLLSSPL